MTVLQIEITGERLGAMDDHDCVLWWTPHSPTVANTYWAHQARWQDDSVIATPQMFYTAFDIGRDDVRYTGTGYHETYTLPVDLHDEDPDA
jgi:hypothetical protein